MSDPKPAERTSSDAAVRVLIPASWEVPTIFRNRLGNQVGRQRAMVADGHLLLILHGPPAPDEHDRQGRLFWRDPDGTWKFNCPDSPIKSLHGHLKEYGARIEKLEEQEEAAKSADEYFKVISDLLPLHRAARNMHAAVQTARQEIKEAKDIINFRDEAYEIERTSELLHADAKNELDFIVVRRGEKQAQASYKMGVSSHRLNVLVAFFFPIATLSSIFGTNLIHGYENKDSPWLFLLMLLSGLLFGLVLTIAITRKGQSKT
ncbi:MAG: CorA family divalent cation transporter [Planctomycetales bacterium]|jgi:hypothetical protein